MSPQSQVVAGRPDSLQVGDYLAVISRRRWVFLLFVVLGAVAGWFYASRAVPGYTSQASVIVRPVNVDLDRTNVRVDLLVNLFTERAVIKSEPVAVAVSSRLSNSPDIQTLLDNVSVDIEDGAQVLHIHYKSQSAQAAQLVAQEYASVYLDMREQDAIAEVERRAAPLRERLDTARADLKDANSQIARSGEGSEAMAAAQSRRDVLLSDIQQLQRSLDDVRTMAVDPGTIINPASLPTSRNGFPQSVIIVAGAIVGFLLGAPVAFLLDRLDTRIREADRLAQDSGVEVLGKISQYRFWEELPPGKSVSVVADPESSVTESFRRLGTTVVSRAEATGIRSIAITSPWAVEGVANVAANLAITIAESGLEVLLVSANFREDTLDQVLALDPGRGLADVFAGRYGPADTLQTLPGLPLQLRVMSAGVRDPLTNGNLHPNPLEPIVDDDAIKYDLLIVDTPPVLAVADSLPVVSRVDGVLLVVHWGLTTIEDVVEARDELHAVGAQPLGVVILGI